jgi:hypothetical protein
MPEWMNGELKAEQSSSSFIVHLLLHPAYQYRQEVRSTGEPVDGEEL